MVGKYLKSSASLTPAAFHILLALTAGERHGLRIADEIEAITDGTVQLGPATLYRSLKELAGAGLVREVLPRDPDADPRRRTYALTDAGRAALQADALRYDRLTRLARRRGVLRPQT